MKLAAAHKLKFNDLLSHAMIFYTTGEAMKTVVPSHVPYAELAGIWKGRMGVFKPALDEVWKPYLDGKGTLDEALLALLKRRRHLDAQDHDRSEHEHGGEQQQAAGKAAGRILTQPTTNGPTKPPILPIEFTSAMPPAAAVPRSNAVGQRPIRSQRAPDAEGGDRKRRQRDIAGGRGRQHGQHETGGADQHGTGDMPAPLAGAIGMRCR